MFRNEGLVSALSESLYRVDTLTFHMRQGPLFARHNATRSQMKDYFPPEITRNHEAGIPAGILKPEVSYSAAEHQMVDQLDESCSYVTHNSKDDIVICLSVRSCPEELI